MESKAMRLTWLMSPRNKLASFTDHQRDCHCPANTGSGSVNAPEAFFQAAVFIQQVDALHIAPDFGC